VDPRALRDGYLEALRDHLGQIERLALGFGYDYHRLDTHESVGPPLAYMLARRNASRKRGRTG
jgi:predicted nuclease with TOPRIM domain